MLQEFKVSTLGSVTDSYGHGYGKPAGFVGVGLVGAGVGQYKLTLSKPAPLLTGVQV